MSGSRVSERDTRWWRSKVIGVSFTAAGMLGMGCRSPEADPVAACYPTVAVYPGLNTDSGVGRIASHRVDKHAVCAATFAQHGETTTEEVHPAAALSTATQEPSVPTSNNPTNNTAPILSPPAETIDLEVALRLAGVENPTINLARERVREALAGELAARSLLLPSVTIGGNYHLHNGVLQASPGLIRKVNSQSLFLGFGARSLAAESVAFPGIRLFAHLGDAVYEPLAAQQRVTARRSDAQAVQNATLLEVATAYLELIGAESRLGVLRQGEVDLAEIVRLTRVYAEKGQGRVGDANRAAAHANLLRQEVRRAEEDVAVASARLCQLLNVDPTIRFRTPGGAVAPLRLIPEESNTELLVTTAVQNRPEVVSRSAEIREAQVRARQERVRPWMPLLSVGYSGAWFGGGSNLVESGFGPLGGRSDFDAFAVWNVQNLGFGNRAQVRRADAVVGQTLAEYSAAVNRIRKEVAEAQAEARAALRQISAARASVDLAEEGYGLESQRIRQGQALPIETLDSFKQLLESRQELLRAIIAFDVAQFRVFVAVGSDPMSPPASGVVPLPGIQEEMPKP